MISNLTEVPPNWIKVRFDEIAENITDRIDKPNESGLEYYIGLEHLDTDQIRIKRFGSTEDVEATKFLCKKDDIIFGKRNAYLRKVAVTDRDAVVSAHSMVIRPKSDLIVPEFLPCFMQSSVFWKTAHAISEGSMSPTIKWKTLAKQEFWIPTIEEQKKIAEILWSIEENAEKNERLINTNEVLKKELLQELMTKGLEHKKFKETEIGVIPMDWNVVKMKVVCDVKTGSTPRTKNKDYWGGDILWMASGEVHNKFIYDTDKKITQKGVDDTNLKLHPPNSIMMALNGQGKTRGSVAVIKVPTTCNQSLACLIPNEGEISYLYLFYNLQRRYSEIRNYTGDKGREGLNLTIVKNMNIVLPTLDEQKKIADILELLDKSINKHSKHSGKLHKLKNKLTNNFISGKLIIPKEVL